MTTRRKSSLCQQGECAEVQWRRVCAARDCAEVAHVRDEVLIRSSRAPEQVVRFTGDEWRALADGIRAGEFG